MVCCKICHGHCSQALIPAEITRQVFPPICLASPFYAVLVAASMGVNNWIVRHRVLPKTLRTITGGREQARQQPLMNRHESFIHSHAEYLSHKGILQFSYYFKRSTTSRSGWFFPSPSLQTLEVKIYFRCLNWVRTRVLSCFVLKPEIVCLLLSLSVEKALFYAHEVR